MGGRRAAGARAEHRRRRSRSPTACGSAPGPRSPDAWTVTDRRSVDALSPFYVWTPDYAEKRLAWKRRHPLHVLLLRTYRIPRPVTVKVRDDHGGCRSWLEITRDLPFEGTPGALRRGVRARLRGDHGPSSRAAACRRTPEPPRRGLAWLETASDTFVARYDERDAADVERVLAQLEYTRGRLDARFPRPLGELTVVIHGSARSSTPRSPGCPSSAG